MPLHIVTPIRREFIKNIREQFRDKYHCECLVSDNRILTAALFYKFTQASDPDIELLIGDLYDQHCVIENHHHEGD